MEKLAVYVINWKRPHFLSITLESLKKQNAKIVAIDNESSDETAKIIKEYTNKHILLKENYGINQTLEWAVPHNNDGYVMVSDSDMMYKLPLQLGIDFLEAHIDCGCVSYQNSPEHPKINEVTFKEQLWWTKEIERGCAVMFRATDFE